MSSRIPHSKTMLKPKCEINMCFLFPIILPPCSKMATESLCFLLKGADAARSKQKLPKNYASFWTFFLKAETHLESYARSTGEERKEIRWMLGGRTPKTRKGIELCGFDNKEVHKQRRRQDGREKCWSVYAGGVASRCADTQPRRDPDSGLEPK